MGFRFPPGNGNKKVPSSLEFFKEIWASVLLIADIVLNMKGNLSIPALEKEFVRYERDKFLGHLLFFTEQPCQAVCLSV